MNTRNQHMHNKSRLDDLRLKIKLLLIKYITQFIKDKIKEIYNKEEGKDLVLKKLSNNGVLLSHDRDFVKKTLKEMFISNGFYRKQIDCDKNIKLIERLLNEKDDDKRNYFENLFNLTFLDCLEHFTTKRVIEELQGLKTFLDIKNDENESKRLRLDDKEYLNSFEYALNHYEERLLNKNKRGEKSHE